MYKFCWTDFSEVKVSQRNTLIDIILRDVKKNKDAKRSVVEKLVRCYEGRDRDALVILDRASELGQLDKYISKLGNYLRSNLGYLHPKLRRDSKFSTSKRTDDFIAGCFVDLGMQETNQYDVEASCLRLAA